MQFASGRGTSSSGIVVVDVLVALAILAGALAFRSQPFTSWGFDFFGLLTHSRDQHVHPTTLKLRTRPLSASVNPRRPRWLHFPP